jgi:enamine deaminase RidA (YjgF/YER057c/UK114 family)
VQQLDPSAIAPAAASYSLGTVVQKPHVLVHTSGIVGTSPDGSVADDLALQAAEIWRSIRAVLSEAGLEMNDIASYTTYVVDGEDLSIVMAARDHALAGHRCASTLIVVPRLARPEWRMEIAAVAAR